MAKRASRSDGRAERQQDAHGIRRTDELEHACDECCHDCCNREQESKSGACGGKEFPVPAADQGGSRAAGCGTGLGPADQRLQSQHGAQRWVRQPTGLGLGPDDEETGGDEHQSVRMRRVISSMTATDDYCDGDISGATTRPKRSSRGQTWAATSSPMDTRRGDTLEPNCSDVVVSEIGRTVIAPPDPNMNALRILEEGIDCALPRTNAPNEPAYVPRPASLGNATAEESHKVTRLCPVVDRCSPLHRHDQHCESHRTASRREPGHRATLR